MDVSGIGKTGTGNVKSGVCLIREEKRLRKGRKNFDLCTFRYSRKHKAFPFGFKPDHLGEQLPLEINLEITGSPLIVEQHMRSQDADLHV